MSRRDRDAETQFAIQGPKRPRQDDRVAQRQVPPSLSPIRGFQDNMTSWVSNLINQQDGCLRMVAQQATQGRLRQEQFAQTVSHSAATPSQTNDQIQYLRAQLAHRDA